LPLDRRDVKCGFAGNPVRRCSRHSIKAAIQRQPHCRRVATTGKIGEESLPL
jgi:hypothetical protein